MKITHTRIERVKGSNPTEWQVKAYIANPKASILPPVRYPDADYFTDDKQDAIDTAEAMKNRV